MPYGSPRLGQALNQDDINKKVSSEISELFKIKLLESRSYLLELVGLLAFLSVI